MENNTSKAKLLVKPILVVVITLVILISIGFLIGFTISKKYHGNRSPYKKKPYPSTEIIDDSSEELNDSLYGKYYYIELR